LDDVKQLTALQNAIKDSEVRLVSIRDSVRAVNVELDTLEAVKLALEENIRCLKKKKIVAIAQEFKKSKEELQKTLNRIEMQSNNRAHFLKTERLHVEMIEKIKEDIEKLEKADKNNVLKFKDKKNG